MIEALTAKLPKYTLSHNEKKDCWDLKSDQTGRTKATFDTKVKATAGAQLEEALGLQGGSVKIQKVDGKIQEERTYPGSKDPRKSPGLIFPKSWRCCECGMTILATRVGFDDATMWVELADGRTIGVPLAWFPRLLDASPADRERVEIGHFGLHWEHLDEDISIAGLLAGRGDMTRRVEAAASLRTPQRSI